MERNLKPRNFETLNLQLINKRADIPGVVGGPVVGPAVVVGAVVVVNAAVVVGTSCVDFDCVAVVNSVLVAEASFQVNLLNLSRYIYAFFLIVRDARFALISRKNFYKGYQFLSIHSQRDPKQ